MKCTAFYLQEFLLTVLLLYAIDVQAAAKEKAEKEKKEQAKGKLKISHSKWCKLRKANKYKSKVCT